METTGTSTAEKLRTFTGLRMKGPLPDITANARELLLLLMSRLDEENLHSGWTESGPKRDITSVRGGQQDAGVQCPHRPRRSE